MRGPILPLLWLTVFSAWGCASTGPGGAGAAHDFDIDDVAFGEPPPELGRDTDDRAFVDAVTAADLPVLEAACYNENDAEACYRRGLTQHLNLFAEPVPPGVEFFLFRQACESGHQKACEAWAVNHYADEHKLDWYSGGAGFFGPAHTSCDQGVAYGCFVAMKIWWEGAVHHQRPKTNNPRKVKRGCDAAWRKWHAVCPEHGARCEAVAGLLRDTCRDANPQRHPSPPR